MRRPPGRFTRIVAARVIHRLPPEQNGLQMAYVAVYAHVSGRAVGPEHLCAARRPYTRTGRHFSRRTDVRTSRKRFPPSPRAAAVRGLTRISSHGILPNTDGGQMEHVHLNSVRARANDAFRLYVAIQPTQRTDEICQPFVLRPVRAIRFVLPYLLFSPARQPRRTNRLQKPVHTIPNR